MYEWKIKVASSLKELEKIVEQIQSEGWTIEKIDVKSVSVVAYKARPLGRATGRREKLPSIRFRMGPRGLWAAANLMIMFALVII